MGYIRLFLHQIGHRSGRFAVKLPGGRGKLDSIFGLDVLRTAFTIYEKIEDIFGKSGLVAENNFICQFENKQALEKFEYFVLAGTKQVYGCYK